MVAQGETMNQGETMKASGLIAAVVLSLIALPHARAGEIASRQIAARTELHDIHTLTLTDQQFLAGGTSGKPTTITGELRIAQGSGRLPVVVLQHGSGGFAANIEMWSRELNAVGISTFALDGFTGRGLTEVNSNQALLGRLNFILDIYRALDVLAQHPRVERGPHLGHDPAATEAALASVKAFYRATFKIF